MQYGVSHYVLVLFRVVEPGSKYFLDVSSHLEVPALTAETPFGTKIDLIPLCYRRCFNALA